MRVCSVGIQALGCVGCRSADGACEIGDPWKLEYISDRNFRPGRLSGFGDKLRCKEGVPAEFEEIIVAPDLCSGEQTRHEGAKQELVLGLGRRVRRTLRKPRAAAGVFLRRYGSCRRASDQNVWISRDLVEERAVELRNRRFR